MRRSVGSSASIMLLAIGGMCVTACGSPGKGTVSGNVWIGGPVASVRNTGPATALLLSGDEVIARDHIPAKGTFHFTVPAGKYRLTVAGMKTGCMTTVTVPAHQHTATDIHCPTRSTAG